MDDHSGGLRCRRFGFLTLFVAFCGMSLALSIPSAFAASPVGLWYAEGGAAEVQIVPCSAALCGKVVWLHSPLGEDGCELRDENNPDLNDRNRPIVGLEVLRGLKQADDEGSVWT